MQSEVSPSPALRVCSTCFTAHPAEHFRHRRRGEPERVAECNGCHATRERERRSKAKGRWLASKLAELSREGLRPTTPNRRVSLADEIIRRLGGVDATAHQWVEHLQAAPPGSSMVLKGYLAMMALFISLNIPG